jgi:predicted nuclease of predicted toxin-antitoxin system
LLKFLIDECLSPKLVDLASSRGFVESSHVVWIRKAGLKDWELKKILVEADWTFVTNNSADFRGPSDQPGKTGQYANVFLHAGLICLNSDARMNQAIQVDLFAYALDQLGSQSQLVNEVLEVDLDQNGLKRCRRYSLPRQSDSAPD